MAQPQAAPAREYETIYILRSDVETGDAKKVAERVEEVMGKTGGRLTAVESWGRRLLAYPVRKQKRGIYVYLKYLGGGALVSELERNLRLLDPVLKFQTVLLRSEVDAEAVAVDPAAVQFEPPAPMTEDDIDEPLERTLGLETHDDRAEDGETTTEADESKASGDTAPAEAASEAGEKKEDAEQADGGEASGDSEKESEE